jgi:peptidylprolyl isomerase
MKAFMVFVGILLLCLDLMSSGLVQGICMMNSFVAEASSEVSVEANSVYAGTTFNCTVTLSTTMGIIVIGMFDDMPITSGNFENLTKHGVYDGTIFHRVVHNFVIQGGDASGKGIIVPTIPDELPNKHSNARGSVAMANTGQPNSATSQFYINLMDNTGLDKGYVVFGQVIQGMSVVDNIGNVTTDVNDRPLQNVTIVKAILSPGVPEFSFLAYVTLFMAITLLTAVFQRARKTGLMPRQMLRQTLLTCRAIERSTG